MTATLTPTYDPTQPIDVRINHMRDRLPAPVDRKVYPYHRKGGKPTLHFIRAQTIARIIRDSGEDGRTWREIITSYEGGYTAGYTGISGEPMERGYFNWMRKILSMTYNNGETRFVAWKIPGKSETRYLFTSDPDKMHGNVKIAKKSIISTLESKEGVIAVLSSDPDPDHYRAGQALAWALKVLRDKPDPL